MENLKEYARDTEGLRLEAVLLNERNYVGTKAKVALNMADEEGHINEKNKITDVIYRGYNSPTDTQITFEKYKEFGKPEYIIKKNNGSLSPLPEEIWPMDFPPKKFD